MKAIRQLREERGWSQAKLAVTAGMDPATLNRLEQGKGNPNLKTLEKIAEALGISISALFRGEEEGKAQPRLPLHSIHGGRGLEELSPGELGDLITKAEAQALANLEREYAESEHGFRTSSDGWIDMLNDFSDLAAAFTSDSKISPEAVQLMQCLDFSIFSTYLSEEDSIKALCRPGRLEGLNKAEERFAQVHLSLQKLSELKAFEADAEESSEFMARVKQREADNEDARERSERDSLRGFAVE